METAQDVRLVRKARDGAVILAVTEQLAASASSLGAVELVKTFAALVRLDFYHQKLLGNICAAIALKFPELLRGGKPAFAQPQAERLQNRLRR